MCIKKLIISCLLAVVLQPFSASATPIYEQDFDANLTSANAISDFHPGIQRADDFELLADASIGIIRWLGIYINSNTPAQPDNFTIRLFSNAGILPETTPTLLNLNVGNTVNRIDTAVDTGNKDIYSYEVTLNPGINLLAGDYWLSIVNDTSADNDDDWSWAASNVSDDQAFRFSDGSAWNATNGRLQFELTAVPIPAAFWFMVSGLIALFSLQRKRMV